MDGLCRWPLEGLRTPSRTFRPSWQAQSAKRYSLLHLDSLFLDGLCGSHLDSFRTLPDTFRASSSPPLHSFRREVLDGQILSCGRHFGGPQTHLFHILIRCNRLYTITYHIISYRITLYYVILSYPILYHVILYYTTLYYTTLYHTIPYYTTLYHTIPYYTIP